MDNESLSSQELIEKLRNDPSDELISELARRMSDPTTEFATRNAIIRNSDTSAHPIGQAWSNCIGGETCFPKDILKPTNLGHLLDAVQTAKKNKYHLRAVGSGHSFSDVCPTDGILLDLQGMSGVLDVDANILNDSNLSPYLVSVESGITIADLNNYLDSRNRALINIGAYDGQTLAGAISTGTHGTGIAYGPIASSVRALVLVSSNGKIYQIEPSDGITDPAKFGSSHNPHKIELKQDDDLFNASLVAMGCTGLIYAYILSVVPAFNLEECRTKHTWEELKDKLRDGASSPILTENERFEIDMNPYVDQNGPHAGKHQCIQILHNSTDKLIGGNRGPLNWSAGILSKSPQAQAALVAALNLSPRHTVSLISKALGSLVTPRRGYVDKSYKVMNVGGAVNDIKAYALELSMPCDEKLVDNVDKLLGVLAQAAENGQYLAGPLNLRFVAESNAFLAPQANRATCMVEMDTLVGIKTSPTLLKDHVKKKMCTPNSGIRVHWGLDLNTVTKEDVPKWYPDFPKWRRVYNILNEDGMWNNKFTDRIGVSVNEEDKSPKSQL